MARPRLVAARIAGRWQESRAGDVPDPWHLRAGHPWLARASAYCTAAIADLDRVPHAHELLFAIRFLDAAAGGGADTGPLLGRLAQHIPADGCLRVEGGAEDEALQLLDISPDAGAPSRRLCSDEAIAADRSRLAQLQQPDGGWLVDFESYSPAAALEWRGYATVAAIAALRDDR